MENQKTILIGVSDVFFYTKIRDALRPQGFSLERIRKQEEVIPKASTLQPLAVILNMNDDNLNATQALQALKGDNRLKHLPVLAFANHEEVDTWRARIWDRAIDFYKEAVTLNPKYAPAKQAMMRLITFMN